MPQFTVIFTNGGSYMVTAVDKYDAIDKAKSKNPNSGSVGVKEDRDSHGKRV